MRTPRALAQAPAGEPFCRPADATSARLVEELRRILSSSDSSELELRRRARIVYQPTGTVAYVSDEPVCGLAIQALNRRARTPERQRQVYVYSMGSQYAVEDPEQRASEYRMLRIFSLEWELQGDVLIY
jgi:hypothetical protein